MKKPKLSIIITSKNEEKYIESCLKSVKNQTFENYEIIVSDSVSKDKTVKISKKYADKILVRKTNISEGRNFGAEFADGEILIFLDADTMLLPNTLEEIMKEFKDKKTIGVGCPALPTNANIKYVASYIFYNTHAETSIKLGKPQISGFFCAYRKKEFEKIGGFDSSIGILEDFDLSSRISKLGKIKFAKNTLVITSHRRLKKWGIRSVDKYISSWIKLVTTGKSFSQDWYKMVR